MTTTHSVLTGTKLVLARDCWAVGIHGVTGQETETGTLAAGTLVRNVVTHPVREGGDGSPVRDTTFEASTDDGETWYQQQTTEAPENLVKWSGDLRVIETESGDDDAR